MDPAHERAYRQLAQRLQQPKPRPGVIWVACADLSLRAEVEARLVSDLAIPALSVLSWNAHPVAPWDEILNAWAGSTSERRLVSVHYDAIEPTTIDLSRFDDTPQPDTSSNRALLQLNVGRDLGVRRGAVVLLWVRGLGPLETVQSSAPDLWSHRLLVCRFPSAADFSIRAGEHFGEPYAVSLGARIAELEAGLGNPWVRGPQRLELLDTLVSNLGNAERWSEMLQRLEELRTLYETEGLYRDPLYVAGLLNRALDVAIRLRDIDRLEALLHGAPRDRSVTPWTDAVIALGFATLYVQQGRDVEALAQYEKRLAADDALMAAQARGFAFPGAFALIARAEHFLYELELPTRAVMDAREAEHRVAHAATKSLVDRHGIQSDIEALLAEARRRMGFVDEALMLGWRAVQRRIALRARVPIDILQDIYGEMGLPGLPRMLWLVELEELESAPVDEATPESRRRIHQALAELGLMLGDAKLLRAHGPNALMPFSTAETPPSLSCDRLRVRARHARKLRPQWHDPTELDHWAEAILATLQASQTSPFHRDLLRMELARWRLAQRDLDAAAALVAEALDHRSKHLGPRKIIDARILAAEIEHGRGKHANALAHLDAAHDMLCAQPQAAQPFFLWSRLQRQRATLAHAEGQPGTAWAAFDVLLVIADRRHLVPDAIDLRLEQAETNLGHPKAQDNADACLARALELGYMRLEGRARLLLAELAWRRNDRATATRELVSATWLVGQLGPIDAQQRARALSSTLGASA